MEFLLTEIESALDAGLYYMALQSTLTLPDICSTLESPKGETTGAQYIAWYNTHAKEPGCAAMTGEVCWRLRCSYLHEGNTQNPRSPFSRILFSVTDHRHVILHNIIVDDVMNVDLVIFCRNVISSVRKWEAKMKDNPTFLNNYKKLIKTHPMGLAPYITGIPIIT